MKNVDKIQKLIKKHNENEKNLKEIEEEIHTNIQNWFKKHGIDVYLPKRIESDFSLYNVLIVAHVEEAWNIEILNQFKEDFGNFNIVRVGQCKEKCNIGDHYIKIIFLEE